MSHREAPQSAGKSDESVPSSKEMRSSRVTAPKRAHSPHPLVKEVDTSVDEVSFALK